MPLSYCNCILLPARCCAIAAYSTTSCLSIYHRSVLYRNGWSDQAHFSQKGCPRTPSLRWKGILVSLQIRVLLSRTYCWTFGHREKNLPLHVDRRMCCQQSSTDHRRQFIKLSVILCVQRPATYRHDAAARRMGVSATACTCPSLYFFPFPPLISPSFTLHFPFLFPFPPFLFCYPFFWRPICSHFLRLFRPLSQSPSFLLHRLIPIFPEGWGAGDA